MTRSITIALGAALGHALLGAPAVGLRVRHSKTLKQGAAGAGAEAAAARPVSDRLARLVLLKVPFQGREKSIETIAAAMAANRDASMKVEGSTDGEGWALYVASDSKSMRETDTRKGHYFFVIVKEEFDDIRKHDLNNGPGVQAWDKGLGELGGLQISLPAQAFVHDQQAVAFRRYPGKTAYETIQEFAAALAPVYTKETENKKDKTFVFRVHRSFESSGQVDDSSPAIGKYRIFASNWSENDEANPNKPRTENDEANKPRTTSKQDDTSSASCGSENN